MISPHQAQADFLGRTVQRPSNIETTALGAAYCTAIGAGIVDLADFTDGQVLIASAILVGAWVCLSAGRVNGVW